MATVAGGGIVRELTPVIDHGTRKAYFHPSLTDREEILRQEIPPRLASRFLLRPGASFKDLAEARLSMADLDGLVKMGEFAKEQIRTGTHGGDIQGKTILAVAWMKTVQLRAENYTNSDGIRAKEEEIAYGWRDDLVNLALEGGEKTPKSPTLRKLYKDTEKSVHL